MKKYRVLFIGNSYTFYNEMPTEMFLKIAQEAGYTVEVDRVLKGGWTLEKHADPQGETGMLVDQLLRGEPYDYVILQEQSLRPSVDPEPFFCAVRDLNARIRANGALPVLYSTWGRKTGSPKLSEYNMTSESMTLSTARSYRSIASELSIPVAYAGLAFFDIAESIELYDQDKSHPSREGSYLAALVLFLRIFGDCEKLCDCGFSQDVSDVLQKAARKAVFDTPDF